jgi:hypothetical protein
MVCTGGNCEHQSYKVGEDRAIQNIDIGLAGFIGERVYMKPDRKRVFSGSLLSNAESLDRCTTDYLLVVVSAEESVQCRVQAWRERPSEERFHRIVTQVVRDAANGLAQELRQQWWPSVTALAEQLLARCGPTGCRLLTNEVHEILIGANDGIGRDYINRLTNVYGSLGLMEDPANAAVA